MVQLPYGILGGQTNPVVEIYTRRLRGIEPPVFTGSTENGDPVRILLEEDGQKAILRTPTEEITLNTYKPPTRKWETLKVARRGLLTRTLMRNGNYYDILYRFLGVPVARTRYVVSQHMAYSMDRHVLIIVCSS